MIALYFASFFFRTAIPGTIFNSLQADPGLSAAMVTGLGSVFLYVYAASQLLVGFAADRFGGSRLLITGGALMGLGATLFPLCQSVGTLYLTRALTGLGAGFIYLSITHELEARFGPQRFPALLGRVLACGYLGGMAAMLPFEQAAAVLGWRLALLLAGGATIGVFVCAALTLRGRKTVPTSGRQLTFGAVGRVVRNRRAWPFLVVTAINFPIYLAIQAVLGKKFLEDFAELGSATAAGFTSVMMVVTAVSVLLAGPLLRCTGQRRKPLHYLSAGLVVTALVLLVVGVWLHVPAWVFLLSYVSLGLSNVSSPAGAATMKELSEAGQVALPIAVCTTLSYVSVAVLVHFAGLVLDAFGGTSAGSGVRYPAQAYGVVFSTFLGLAGISLLATVFVPETGNSLARSEIRSE